MGKNVLRVLQIVSGAVAVLLIIPVAENIGTGGTPPHWLRPYTAWLWPAALGCVVMVIVLEAVDRLDRPSRTMSSRRPNDARNFALALAQAEQYVTLRQRGSLAERLRLELALDERPSAVRQPAHLVQRVSGNEFSLVSNQDFAEVFNEMSESLLILGAPGAGKTTLLLDLAAALIARARTTSPPGDEPIPVVIDLADWSRSRLRRLTIFGAADHGPRDFLEWLLATLHARYHIPLSLARAWLADDRFTFLLDGLDEVGVSDQDRCVDEINALQVRIGVTRIAVCSRVADYDRLTARLRLQGAVVVRPLTEEQVVSFFSSVSPQLSSVAEALRSDAALWELLTTPLMLNIMALAYRNRDGELPISVGTPADQRRLLFDAYVVEVLARRRSHERDGAERALAALRTLAAASVRLNTGVQVPILTSSNADQILDATASATIRYRLFPATSWAVSAVSAAAAGVVLGPEVGIVVGLAVWAFTLWYSAVAGPRPPKTRAAPVFYCAAGAAGASIGLLWIFRQLEAPLTHLPRVAYGGIALLLLVVEVLSIWLVDGSEGARADKAIMVWISVILFPGVVLSGWLGVSVEAIAGFALGFVAVTAWCGFAAVFVAVEAADSSPLLTADEPASQKRPTASLAVYSIALLAAPFVAFQSWHSPHWIGLAGWVGGVAYGFVPAVVLAIFAQGLAVRAAMMTAGQPVPWRHGFLRFAVDRSLLTVTDGEHRFIHLLIRDHLAECDPEALAGQITRRRSELLAVTGQPLSQAA